MNTNMNSNINTNLKELNLDEMEMINGGWKLADGLVTILTCGTIGTVGGAVIGGVAGAAILGTICTGVGVAVSFM